MKWYFYCKHNTNYIDGVSDIPYYQDGTEELQPWCIEVDNPSEELMTNFLWYKLINGKLIKMDDDEFYKIHPDYGKELPSPEEQQTDFNLDVDYRLSCLELGLI